MNETQNEIGIQKSLDQLQSEMDEQKREAQKNSRFRQIDSGKTAILHFTGKVYVRTSQYEGMATVKLDFELEETTPDGQHKVFSVGSKSAAAREIVRLLKLNRTTMSIGRIGEGKSTRYSVSEVE